MFSVAQGFDKKLKRKAKIKSKGIRFCLKLNTRNLFLMKNLLAKNGYLLIKEMFSISSMQMFLTKYFIEIFFLSKRSFEIATESCLTFSTPTIIILNKCFFQNGIHYSQTPKLTWTSSSENV